MSASPPTACDTIIVGAGIVGLATAREALVRRPGSHVVVLERGPAVAGGQTANNSGVIHAGVYYAPGSRKARLCVDGARRLYELCADLGVPAERCGKLIVARTPEELPRLAELERRAQANAVSVRRLTGAQIADVEPHALGVAALHVRDTGIVDFGRVASALLDDVLARGGTIVTDCAVATIAGGVVRHARGVTRARTVIACAGMDAARLARRSGGADDPRIVPFRGAYLRLRRPELVRALIYPVPDPALPFLGVHLTRRIQGDVVAGPTALPATTGLRDTLTWPGTWRMAWRWRRHALREVGYAASRAAYAREVRTLVPAVNDADLVPAFAGVRAQAVGRDGALLDDFVLTGTNGVLHVRNAPSPAATASLAIAGELVDRAGL